MTAAQARVLHYDARLLFPTLFLVGIGIVMVYSASSALAMKKFGTDTFFLRRQAIYSAVGILTLVTCRHFPYQWFRHLTYPLLALAMAALIAIPFSGLGYSAGGAARWLRFHGLTFQPVELVRFAVIVYLAYSLSKKGAVVERFAIGFLPHFIVFGAFAGLLLMQPDFGSVVILGALTWILLYAGGVRFSHLTAALIVMIPMVYLGMISAEYRFKRIVSFLSPWDYPADHGYQTIHSLMAFGTGGLWGTGIGKSYQKLFYLPEPHTDFIFSVIGEELGLFGVMLILILYAVILWRGLMIARNAQDDFGALMALGLTTALGLQVIVNTGVTLGLLPTKGLTLPFLSYGGTSLLFNMAAIGILMNIGGEG